MDARKVYDEAIVIDGLSISNWESDAVFQRLRAGNITAINACLLYTSPSPRDGLLSRMPSSA